MKKNYTDYYSELLYSLLPELYRTKDHDTEELKRFLGIIGEQAGALRQNMDELWYDFFIETCHDWVVPYIGDLLGANLVFNDAARNRVIVKKTIPWKRSKGTLKGLEDVTRGITGWGVNAVEFFELLNWSQNMNHIKLDKPFTPDIRNIYPLENLGSAYDAIPHTADVRSPSRQHGWYNIKNLGYFFFTKQIYRLEHTMPASISPTKYCFSQMEKDMPLFDFETKDLIKPLKFHRDTYGYFGTDNGMSIYCNGVLVASPRPPPPAPVRPDKDEKGCTVGELNGGPGMRLLDWQGRGNFRIEALDAAWDGVNKKYSVSKVWGSLTTSDMQYSKGAAGNPGGSFMLRISLETNARAALFQEAILVLRGVGEITAKDTKESVYSNALYIYMPEVFLGKGNELYLFTDHAGATYYTFEGSVKTGDPTDQSVIPKPIVPPEKAFEINNIARESEGQVYPPRGLTNSMKPLVLDSINRKAGLTVCDKKRFQGRHFTIKCCSIDFSPGQPKELGKLRIDGTGTSTIHEYTSGQEPDRKGFGLRIKHEGGDKRFPQCELVLKDSRGGGVLIYLPEIDFKSAGEYTYLYPADDGSTYYTNNIDRHTGEPVLKPDRGGAFSITLLARKSAGQVLPISDTFPLQQRMAEYRDLCSWDHPEFRKPDAGNVAIDPALGRFCFPDDEVPEGTLTVKYNDAFTHDVGAWTVDRRAGLREPDVKVRGSDKSDTGVYTVSDEIAAALDKGVVQIEDSLTYREINPLLINKSLTIQAANFQRPTITGNITVNGSIEELRLDGLFFTAGNSNALIKVEAPVNKLVISNCTFDPGKVFLEVSDNVTIGSVEINNSITGKISCKSADSIQITDSIVHSKDDTAISGRSDTDNSGAVLRIERTTIIGGCLVKELYSSNSIHMGKIKVINTQHGCIRYSRYQDKGSTLPRVFNSTQDIPLFNSRSFWRFDYYELSQNCSEKIRTGSEKGSEIGAFSAAQNTIKEKNVRIKLQEYMPFGQRPVIIYEL